MCMYSDPEQRSEYPDGKLQRLRVYLQDLTRSSLVSEVRGVWMGVGDNCERLVPSNIDEP